MNKSVRLSFYARLCSSFLLWFFIDIYIFENATDYIQKPLNTKPFENISIMSAILLPIFLFALIVTNVILCALKVPCCVCNKQSPLKSKNNLWKMENKRLSIILTGSKIMNFVFGAIFGFCYLFAKLRVTVAFLILLNISIILNKIIGAHKFFFVHNEIGESGEQKREGIIEASIEQVQEVK
ncbi:Hypothetical_protein [Hexamita inflata]|uniref:Hypothetical_protein n=1 Tax=Hexamita inflata TaxID=28002 RepID=A0AA86RMP5_9EUKA|nr:Hypothetical protein HINF_LOCUS56890 [Hexamita inflata]